MDNLALKRIRLALSKPKEAFVDNEKAKAVASDEGFLTADFYKDLDTRPSEYVSSNDNIPNMNIASVGDNILVQSVMQSITSKIKSGWSSDIE